MSCEAGQLQDSDERGRHPALSGAAARVLWLDRDPGAPRCSALESDTRADLVIVGGGYLGLWTALVARERCPDLDVVLLDAADGGWQPSVGSSGLVPLHPADPVEGAVRRYNIDCDFDRTSLLYAATDEMRALVGSPASAAGLHERDQVAAVDPVRLARGLQAACLATGVRLRANSYVTGVSESKGALDVTTSAGARVRAAHVAITSSTLQPVRHRLRLRSRPEWEHVVASEPLSGHQLHGIGWSAEAPLVEHVRSTSYLRYLRLTKDRRIVAGGFEPAYGARGSGVAARQRETRHDRLARDLLEIFPQLWGLRFTHQWTGYRDRPDHGTAHVETTHDGQVAHGVGYTHGGISATRHGAELLLARLTGSTVQPTVSERQPRERRWRLGWRS